ncbi:MAG: cell division protein FtsA [Oscillospiraceae bacterium]|jgi:cell division protein FtsA|nr:cell division protein FtsA [Oscillospiraceae bacterium]
MKNLAVAIDFGTSKIVTFVAESGSYHRCDIIGASTVSYDGFMDGYWNAPDLVDQAIRTSVAEAEAKAHRRIRDVYIGVPGEFCRVYVTEAQVHLQGADPRVTPADVESVFKQATDDIMPIHGVIVHRSPAWFAVDEGKKTMEPIGVKGSALRALVSFVVADEFFLSDISRRMRQLGMTVNGFFSSSVGQALLYLPPDERDRVSVLIDVGHLCTEIMAVEGDALVFQKVIPIGGGHITADLAFGLEVNMDIAEQVKRAYSFDTAGQNVGASGTSTNRVAEGYPHDKVAPVLEPRVDELCEFIKDALDHSGVHLDSWSNIYLTGGGLAMINGGRAYLSAQLDRTVRAPAPKAAKFNSPVYSSALGLIDLVFGSLEAQEEAQGVFDKTAMFFRNLLKG